MDNEKELEPAVAESDGEELTTQELNDLHPDYGEEILSLIRSNASPKILREKLEDYHGNDIADILSQLTVPERVKLYRILPIALLSDVLEYTDEEEGSVYLQEMDGKKAAAVISELEPDYAVDILRQFPKDKRLLLMDLLDEESKKDVLLIASFDEDEIGSRMTTNYIAIHDGLNVKEAMSELVRQAAENDNISTIFVIDEAGVFYGAIDLKDLIIARAHQMVDDLVVTSFPYVYARESIDDCLERLKDYSEDCIPVLDTSNRLLGVITSQNIVQVVDDEMGEDFARLAGLAAEEDLAEPLSLSIRKRLPWLAILLCLGMCVSAVIGLFEKVVAELPMIMAFQSLVLGMAGNTGTQSLGVSIRVLVDENLTFKQKASLVFKEMRVGLCNGLIIGSISFLALGLYIMLAKGQAATFSFAVSGCCGIAMLIAIIISSTSGTLIPLFFKKIKIDPAVASGPLISTLNDLIAAVTYYSLSWVLLINVLGY